MSRKKKNLQGMGWILSSIKSPESVFAGFGKGFISSTVAKRECRFARVWGGIREFPYGRQ